VFIFIHHFMVLFYGLVSFVFNVQFLVFELRVSGTTDVTLDATATSGAPGV